MRMATASAPTGVAGVARCGSRAAAPAPARAASVPLSAVPCLSPRPLSVRHLAAAPTGVVARTGGGSGGGVLDKPGVVIDKPDIGTILDREVGKENQRKQAPPYKVLLHNDDFNRREYVVQVLMKCIPAMTLDVAVNVMNEAHVNGLATVIVCGREEAEDYCEALRNNGLISSIEPHE